MLIRNIRPDDYEAVDHLMQQLHKVHVDGRPDLFTPLEHPYSKEEFEKLVDDDKAISIAAEENHMVIGICFVSIRDKSGMVSMKTAYMDDLVVAKEYQHRGIARALFVEAEKQAKELGAVRMDLMVWSFNESARKLYETLGMTPQRYIFEKKLGE
jgi:ribosomal protein S18 acetylase RimI-like enzyme